MTDDNHWAARGACRTVDPDTMYADDPMQVAAAKALCRACPVRQQCLDAALALPRPSDQWGVWGGYDHEERRRILNGATPQPCTVCANPFVPSLDHQHRCTPCNQPKYRHAPLPDQHRTQVTTWVTVDHLSDPQIAEKLGTNTKRVEAARKRWGLPAGVTLRPKPANTPKPAPPPQPGPIRPNAVDAVTAGRAPFRTLNQAERVELWRRHTAAGGSVRRFGIRYGVSWRVVRKLRDTAQHQHETAVAA